MSEGSNYAKMYNARLSGFEANLGLRFTEMTPDLVEAELPIRPVLLQPYGLVHGGVYCSMIETLCSVGAALWALPSGRTTVGLDNNTSFLRAAREGLLRGRATPLHRGRRTQLWQAEIRIDDGECVATGQVRMMMLDKGAALAGQTVEPRDGVEDD